MIAPIAAVLALSAAVPAQMEFGSRTQFTGFVKFGALLDAQQDFGSRTQFNGFVKLTSPETPGGPMLPSATAVLAIVAPLSAQMEFSSRTQFNGFVKFGALLSSQQDFGSRTQFNQFVKFVNPLAAQQDFGSRTQFGGVMKYEAPPSHDALPGTPAELQAFQSVVFTGPKPGVEQGVRLDDLFHSVTLRFIAPTEDHDDPASGAPEAYLVWISEAPLAALDPGAAVRVSPTIDAGGEESITLQWPLSLGKTVHLAVLAEDRLGQRGPASAIDLSFGRTPPRPMSWVADESHTLVLRWTTDGGSIKTRPYYINDATDPENPPRFAATVYRVQDGGDGSLMARAAETMTPAIEAPSGCPASARGNGAVHVLGGVVILFLLGLRLRRRSRQRST